MQQNLNAKYIKFLSDDEGKSKILASELNVPQAEFDAVWSWFLLLLQRQSKLDVFGDDVIKDLASRLETLAANLSQSAQNFVLAKLIYYNNIIQSGHLDSAVCGIMSKFLYDEIYGAYAVHKAQFLRLSKRLFARKHPKNRKTK